MVRIFLFGTIVSCTAFCIIIDVYFKTSSQWHHLYNVHVTVVKPTQISARECKVSFKWPCRPLLSRYNLCSLLCVLIIALHQMIEFSFTLYLFGYCTNSLELGRGGPDFEMLWYFFESETLCSHMNVQRHGNPKVKKKHALLAKAWGFESRCLMGASQQILHHKVAHYNLFHFVYTQGSQFSPVNW